MRRKWSEETRSYLDWHTRVRRDRSLNSDQEFGRADEVLRSVGRTTEGDTTESDTAAARTSGPADERPSLFVSFFVVTRPSKAVSGPGAVRERTRAERPADWSGRSHQMAQFKLS